MAKVMSRASSRWLARERVSEFQVKVKKVIDDSKQCCAAEKFILIELHSLPSTDPALIQLLRERNEERNNSQSSEMYTTEIYSFWPSQNSAWKEKLFPHDSKGSFIAVRARRNDLLMAASRRRCHHKSNKNPKYFNIRSTPHVRIYTFMDFCSM